MSVRFISQDFAPIIEAAVRQALPKIQAKREQAASKSLFAGLGALALAAARRKTAPTMADLQREDDELREFQDRAAGAF